MSRRLHSAALDAIASLESERFLREEVVQAVCHLYRPLMKEGFPDRYVTRPDPSAYRASKHVWVEVHYNLFRDDLASAALEYLSHRGSSTEAV